MPKDRPEHRLYDKRIVKRFTHAGVVDERAYEKFVSSLPDLQDEAEIVDVAIEPVDEVGPAR